MSTTATVFDGKIIKWKQEMDLPWAKLKYKLGQANLAKHLGQNPMRILDAGGGNGLDSLPLAKLGNFVDIVDYSQEMLADVQRRAAQENIQNYIATHLFDVKNIANLFPGSQFDLILCHNVLQYIEDVPALLKIFSKLLKPDGILSVISINRYSTPYHAAFLDDNLAEALVQLDTRTSKAKIFDAVMTNYCADEIKELLENVGIVTEGEYGIRCICDYWGDNERKLDPVIFEQIERLEFALTELHPYKLLARYFQVVARKPKSA
jgi:S-adenosylmethionine-dependent methyltransferase